MTTPSGITQPKSAFDVLRLPVIGPLLKRRYGRLMLQIPLLVVAVVLVYDGFSGSPRAAENLATVAPWVHYRGLIVVALLLAGNLFCMGCPFTIPRTLAKRLSSGGRRFPRLLRHKWLAIAGLFIMFYLYEWLDLWASPALTAWVIVFYFVGSFVLEAVFSESAFCKYVCPLGTFNFVYSTLSPTQISARSLDICRTCVGRECVNGSYSAQPVIRVDEIPGGETREVIHNPQGILGCGTQLFVPQITSNMECVLCLDCVRACPHDNVALAVRSPGHELSQPDAWPKRWDMSFLVIALAFMGLSNAFGMVPPVYTLLDELSVALNTRSEGLLLLIVFGVANIVLPITLALAAAWLTQMLTRTARKISLRQTVATFAPAFAPIGFGIWMAHYSFHFLTGFLTIIPVFQSFLLDHRITFLGEPNWALGGIQDTNIIGAIQFAVMMGCFLWTMVIAQRAALRVYRRDGMLALLPWALLFLGMMAAALTIFGLPMEMRGTILS